MTDAVLVMPYRRWHRWVRALRVRSARVHGQDGSDRVYLVYGVVLVALMYGPMLWTALAQGGAALGGGVLAAGSAPDVLLAGVVLMTAAAGVLGVVAARLGGPLWTDAVEVAYALSGQFPPRDVLGGRAAPLCAGAAVVAGACVAGFASGALGGAGGAAAVLAWGAFGGATAQVPLLLGVAAQAPRRRAAAWVVAGGLVVVAALGAAAALGGQGPGTCTPPGGGGACGAGPGVIALALAAVAGSASAALVITALPAEIDVDATAAARGRTLAAGAGLAGGNLAGMVSLLGSPRLARRRATFPGLLLHRAPVVARDVLGLSRHPAASLGSVVAGAAGAALVTAARGSGATLTVVLGALTLYAASAAWSRGLRDLASQPVPGGLLPGSVARLFAAHAVAPALAGLVAAGLGLGAAVIVDGPGVAELARLAMVLLVVLAARWWVSGATTAPAAVFTPIASPAGDASQVVLAAWYLRGWLVVVGAAWATTRFGPGAAPVLALAAAGLVAGAVARVRRA